MSFFSSSEYFKKTSATGEKLLFLQEIRGMAEKPNPTKTDCFTASLEVSSIFFWIRISRFYRALAITFPFNITLGIPLYLYIAQSM